MQGFPGIEEEPERANRGGRPHLSGVRHFAHALRSAADAAILAFWLEYEDSFTVDRILALLSGSLRQV